MSVRQMVSSSGLTLLSLYSHPSKWKSSYKEAKCALLSRTEGMVPIYIDEIKIFVREKMSDLEKE